MDDLEKVEGVGVARQRAFDGGKALSDVKQADLLMATAPGDTLEAGWDALRDAELVRFIYNQPEVAPRPRQAAHPIEADTLLAGFIIEEGAVHDAERVAVERAPQLARGADDDVVGDQGVAIFVVEIEDDGPVELRRHDRSQARLPRPLGSYQADDLVGLGV